MNTQGDEEYSNIKFWVVSFLLVLALLGCCYFAHQNKDLKASLVEVTNLSMDFSNNFDILVEILEETEEVSALKDSYIEMLQDYITELQQLCAPEMFPSPPQRNGPQT